MSKCEFYDVKGWNETKICELLIDLNVGKEMTYKIIKTVLQHERKSGKEVDSGSPCMDCGGTKFIQTGTCHVCVICGASQGCS